MTQSLILTDPGGPYVPPTVHRETLPLPPGAAGDPDLLRRVIREALTDILGSNGGGPPEPQQPPANRRLGIWGVAVLGAAGVALDLDRNWATGLPDSNGNISYTSQAILSQFIQGTNLMGWFDSATIIADDDITVDLDPGGSQECSGNSPFLFPIEGVKKMTLSAGIGRSFAVRVFFSYKFPIESKALSLVQERYGSQTLTKVAAAGVADDFTALNVAANWHTTQLASATYGHAFIHPRGYRNHILIAVNPDAADQLDINLQVLQINRNSVTLATDDWQDHPSTGASTTIAVSSAALIIIKNEQYHYMRLRGRPNQAADTDATVIPRISYAGMAG